MAKKHHFISTFINVLKHNKDGSYRTQDNRRKIVLQIANTLWQMGYKLDGARYIRTRHVYKLIEYWQGNGDSTGTLRNKAAALRKHQYVNQQDKSRQLTEEDLAKIKLAGTSPIRTQNRRES